VITVLSDLLVILVLEDPVDYGVLKDLPALKDLQVKMA
jgi:hypothetical protein